MHFQCIGYILTFLAAATVGLGVADIVLTSQYYCQSGAGNTYCSNTGEPYVWVWVASGIWGGLPIFFTGLYCICYATDPARARFLSLLFLLSAFVFSVAIAVLSAVEVWRGNSSQWSFYSLGNGTLSPGNIQPATNPYQAKFAIPVAVAVLGAILHFFTFWITISMCCCPQCLGLGASTTVIQQAAPVVQEITYQQPRPQIMAPPCDPCSQYPILPQPPVRYNGCSPGYVCGGGGNRCDPNTFFYSNNR